jgi:hypothetical protein
MPVIRYSSFVICCAFIRQSLFVINRSFILFVVRLLFFFSFSLNFVVVVVQKREENNSDPELCSGISILQYIKYLLTVTCFNIII